jgi:hypothetical protein
MRIRFNDFTKYQRRLLARLDDRSPSRPEINSQERESDLRVLVAFGLVDAQCGRITETGRRLRAEGELNCVFQRPPSPAENAVSGRAAARSMPPAAVP